jgi:SnoaL-like domain
LQRYGIPLQKILFFIKKFKKMDIFQTKVQEIVDKMAIQEVRTKWGQALDNKNWAQFNSLFADETDTDFTAWGVAPQRVSKEYLVAMFSQQSFRRTDLITQHLYTNFSITIDADSATSVCNFLGQHFIPNFEGGEEYCLRGEYTDGLIRTADGWKINRLKLRIFYQTGNQAILM